MGRLAEAELRLVSLLDSLCSGLMHECMAAACVVSLWDVIMQCVRFFGDAWLVRVGGRCYYLEGVAFVVLCDYIRQDVFVALHAGLWICALFVVGLDALFTLWWWGCRLRVFLQYQMFNAKYMQESSVL
jgi:hypothetical protein